MTASVDISAYLEKFEEFFTDVYDKDLAKFKTAYPTGRSFYVSYKKLELYTPELADDLINHPDVVLEAAKESLIRLIGSDIKNFNLIEPETGGTWGS